MIKTLSSPLAVYCNDQTKDILRVSGLVVSSEKSIECHEDGLQGLAWLGITGAMRTVQGEVPNILLGLTNLHI